MIDGSAIKEQPTPQEQKPTTQQPPSNKAAWWKRPFIREKPKQSPTQNSDMDLDKIISADNKGRIHVDHEGMQRMINRIWKGMREAPNDTRVNVNNNPPSEAKLDVRNFYTPEEIADITDPNLIQTMLEEVMKERRKRGEEPIVDSQGNEVHAYLQPNDPRFTDPEIPDYLKIGTEAYIRRLLEGGVYLGDPQKLLMAAKIFDDMRHQQEQNEQSHTQDTVGFSGFSKVINTDKYRFPKAENPEEKE